MATDTRLMRLEEHQATIHDILRRGERMLRAPERDATALARTRWELARAILAYQGFKHHEIFDPVARRGPALDPPGLSDWPRSHCTQLFG